MDLARLALRRRDARLDPPRLVLGEPPALDEDHPHALVDLQLLRHALLEEQRLLDLGVGDEALREGLLREEEVLVRRHLSISFAGSRGGTGGEGTIPRSRWRSSRVK